MEDSYEKECQTSLLLSLSGGVLLTVPGILFTPAMLRLLNTPEEIMASSAAYLRIYFSGIIFVFLYNVSSAVLRALGDSQRPLYYLIVCCFINIFLDVILVAFFRLGVTGVAIATVTAQAVSALLTLRALCRLDLGGDHPLALRTLHFDTLILSEIFWIGFPAALQSIMNSLPGFLGSDCCCDGRLLFLQNQTCSFLNLSRINSPCSRKIPEAGAGC